MTRWPPHRGKAIFGVMRVLLFHSKTGKYWIDDNAWTETADRAHNFGSSLKAAWHAQKHGLEDVEVYLDFGDSEWDVRMPVLARVGAGNAAGVPAAGTP